jgi:Protein of unknown function (DUF2971)
MAALLYKYTGASYLSRVFERRNYVTLKCSLPKDFNDPYELFLTVDYRERPDVLAFYADLIGTLPQLPVTCFSRSPAIVPMWAHYAENSTGVVLAFDDRALSAAFPESGFGDINYRDKADPELRETLYRAYEIGKMRYLYFLRQGVFSSAYYSKATCWGYEGERRMVLARKEVRAHEGHLLVDVPRDCLKAIICGPRASSETLDLVLEKSRIAKCPVFKMQIGRSSADPYFTDDAGTVHIFSTHGISKATATCKSCGEPVPGRRKSCSWCKITAKHVEDAASRNSFRMLDHYGMLQDYMSGMDDIGRKHRRK